MAGYLESDQFIGDFHMERKEAVEEVYTKFYKEIYYLCRKLLGTREDAQDVTAHAFINLFRKCRDFNSLTNIRAFLYISARNQCLDVLARRKTAAIHARDLAYAIREAYDQVNDELDYCLIQQLEESIKKLPPRSREVIELLFLGEKKYTEVAATLNISVRAVTDARQRGLSILRELLQQRHAVEMAIFLLAFFW
ncbi:MAG: hypothetical protein BGO55_08720 [Sphingobacteriales bacterium 50-39]|nr:sigma-70 family RNA polymerase sigma factor [Sphingobacteriales bacterium]OJW59345.1 MAG: hypothetical protein BGO55_08720 [Sphingobacteriales bacterium 50-39]